ncbi:rcc01693 family protein [Phaeobacter sp. C3_T13_0]|uniref:rcc01693 family protein n=1 Tax=Phaeobacter cretensis TaxID=3342641 RepID=UPI0039BCEEC9
MTGPDVSRSGKRAGFDWPALIRAGLLGLRLQPDQFWRLTPAELRLMLGQDSGVAPLGRAGLDQLMQAFPDLADSNSTALDPANPDPETRAPSTTGAMSHE